MKEPKVYITGVNNILHGFASWTCVPCPSAQFLEHMSDPTPLKVPVGVSVSHVEYRQNVIRLLSEMQLIVNATLEATADVGNGMPHWRTIIGRAAQMSKKNEEILRMIKEWGIASDVVPEEYRTPRFHTWAWCSCGGTCALWRRCVDEGNAGGGESRNMGAQEQEDVVRQVKVGTSTWRMFFDKKFSWNFWSLNELDTQTRKKIYRTDNSVTSGKIPSKKPKWWSLFYASIR